MSKIMTPLAVKEAMLSKIASSLLEEADAKKLKFKYLTADQSKELSIPVEAPGFVIPYFDLDGRQTKFWRFRYLEDTRKGFDVLSGRKALRYVQAAGGINEVYLSPMMDWRKMAENVSIPLIITEGELKAAAATKVGLPTIGLGGVFCFKSNKAKETMLPMLRQITWKARETVICFDSDAITNPMVVMAENQLARLLTDAGATVRIARLPAAEDGGKVGLDDYLLEHDPEELKALALGAELFSTCKALHEMNEMVAYVRDPGLIYDYKNNMRLSCVNFTSHAYSNSHHAVYNEAGKAVNKKTAQVWLEWGHRSELERVTFAPGEPRIFNRQLNMWEGWPVEPKRGEVRPWRELLDHLFTNTEPGARKWFEQWVAYPMQHPGAKMVSAAVFWGRVKGSGKTMVGATIMRVYGRHSAEINDTQIEDVDNTWGENMQFILADDITGHSNRKLANRLKTMCTQQTIKINQKFVPKYTVPDRLNYYFTSNDPDAFYLDDGDRRYFIHEVKCGKLDTDFRKRFISWRDEDSNIAALFHYFLNIDLAGFDPFADAYETVAKEEMTQLVKSDLDSWICDLREKGNISLKLPGDLFTVNEILAAYDPMGLTKVTKMGVARALKKAGYSAPGRNGHMIISPKYGNIRLYVCKNFAKWEDCSAKTIYTHYEENRAMVPSGKPAEKKKPKF